MNYNQLIKDNKISVLIIFASLFSSLCFLFLPLEGDEVTYLHIADNILSGKFYQINKPSTVTPVLPFILAFFKINSFPMLGFALNKLFYIFLTVLGFRYMYLFLRKIDINDKVILSIIALTIVNPIGVQFFARLYPEAILFFCFWGFLYFSISENNGTNFIKMLVFFLLLSMTRYLYFVLGPIVIYNMYQYYKKNKNIYHLIKYTAILSLPVFLWFKYVYNIEHNNLSEISYFNRFRTDNQLLYNIKAGLGIIKHRAAHRINGVPAFISLFVPVTGYRNYILSIILIIGFITGYLKVHRPIGVKVLALSIFLVMSGFVVAGTGFSRYWLILLPSFLLGYYFLVTHLLKFNDKWFIYIAQILSLIYMVNNMRIALLVINRVI